jgi:hypothetical protein
MDQMQLYQTLDSPIYLLKLIDISTSGARDQNLIHRLHKTKSEVEICQEAAAATGG